MKLVTKIVSVSSLMISIVAVLALLGIGSMLSISGSVKSIVNQDVPLLSNINNLSRMQLEQFVWLERVVVANNTGDKKDFDGAIDGFNKLSSAIAAQYDRSISLVGNLANNDQDAGADIKKQLTATKADYKVLNDNANALFQGMRAWNLQDTAQRTTLVEDHIRSISQKLQLVNASVEKSISAVAKDKLHLNSVSTISMIVISILAFFAAMVSGIFIVRSIKRQLGDDPSVLAEIAEALSAGDLDVERNRSAAGVYGALNIMVDKLIDIISGIKFSANEVAVAADQVSQGNANLSQRTQEQASSLEEVASSMEEMTSTVKHNADNASNANELALAAKEQATAGGAVVSEAISAMDEISSSSKKITEITNVINDIAFQTNLLALNAAVEAARAGEHGRGFAVVASEVRNLASRSATAAKEINALIVESLQKVDDGTRLVNQSGSALEEIVSSVKKVSDIVAEIASASNQQSVGINEVNRALIQMDGMTQENAALVEQASAASEAMGVQADRLNKLVEFFMISDIHVPEAQAVERITFNQSGTSPTEKIKDSSKSKALPQSNRRQEQAQAVQSDDEWEDF